MRSNAVRAIAKENGTPTHIVVIGASAGGIQSLQAVLPGLSHSLTAPIVVVLHRPPRPASALRKVLARSSALTVRDARDGERLQPGVVYLAPADLHATVTVDGALSFHDGTKINYVRASADPLFRSAAEVYGPRAIAVILSGGGKNGVHGAKAIRDAGGEVIAQDRATSLHFGMPQAAIDAGAATSVLPVSQIAPRLNQLLSPPQRSSISRRPRPRGLPASGMEADQEHDEH